MNHQQTTLVMLIQLPNFSLGELSMPTEASDYFAQYIPFVTQ
jgi:hypothetical protein